MLASDATENDTATSTQLVVRQSTMIGMGESLPSGTNPSTCTVSVACPGSWEPATMQLSRFVYVAGHSM